MYSRVDLNLFRWEAELFGRTECSWSVLTGTESVVEDSVVRAVEHVTGGVGNESILIERSASITQVWNVIISFLKAGTTIINCNENNTIFVNRTLNYKKD